ncbi:MAG TPA: hypothetical protein PKN62_00120 [bacterium]|nr:hypothetical protein [bacterium]
MKEWPQKKRLLVAKIGISSIMLLLIIGWLYSLKMSMSEDRANDSQQPLLDIQKIKEDVSQSLKEFEKNSQEFKKISTTTVTTTATAIATTTAEMEKLRQENQLKLDNLRQQLEQLSNESTDK